MKRRMLPLLIVLSLLLSLLPTSVLAVDGSTNSSAWWKESVWSTETLVSLGAAPPAYNEATGCYEISTPEQLLFLSGAWKSEDTNGDGYPDAPRNGSYLLTADLEMSGLMTAIGEAITAASGEETAGFMPPISGNKDENADKTDGWFLGSFDGGYHVISNLAIQRTQDKYAALFSYVGNDDDTDVTIRNLGLVGLTVTGKKTAGAFAGVSYGVIENCFASGSIKAKETVGGLVGKCKGGVIRNCASYMKIKATSLVGGLVGSLESSGTVENCYVGGSISGIEADVGGVTGEFSAAKALKKTVCAVKTISSDEGGTNIGPLVGNLSGESGLGIDANYVWEGMSVQGNPCISRPVKALFQYASADTLSAQELYIDTLKWDFDDVWAWGKGHPVLAGFAANENAPTFPVSKDLTVSTPVLRLEEPTMHKVDFGEQAEINASLILPEGALAGEVRVYYGSEADGSSFEQYAVMTAGEDGYSAVLPMIEPGMYYYYISCEVDGSSVTAPYSVTASLPLTLDDGVVDAMPREVLCQVGETWSEVGFNWLTEPEVTDSKVWYREQGTDTWSVAEGESVLHYLVEGWEETQSHWATITGLKEKTTYEYQVGGVYEDEQARSEIYTFTTLPASGSFTFMQFGDLQAEDAEGYAPFLNTMKDFVSTLEVQPDFLLNTGDIVADGYKASQWSTFFEVAEEYTANRLNIMLPGNHENAGDLLYQQYGARTSLPNEPEYGPLEGTGWCVVGDVCFVFVNADPYSGEDGADLAADRERFFAEQTAWAKGVYEAADTTWRVMVAHVGTYIVNFNDVSDYPYIPAMCDELQIDLYINGHDHEYIRTTTKDDQVVEVGSGTTYMTCSSLGEKLDAFEEGTCADKYAVVHTDGAEYSQQIFSMVTVDETGIHVTAYQRGVDEDWSVFNVIDQFDITTSLTKGAVITDTPQISIGNDPEEKGTAVASELTVIFNGDSKTLTAYAIRSDDGDTGYVKFRDLAYLLNGSAVQFNVKPEGKNIRLEAGTAYVPVPGDTTLPFSGDQPYVKTTNKLLIGNKAMELTAFLITDSNGGGHTYVKIADLAQILNFRVWYKDGIHVDTTVPFNPADFA